MTKIPPYLKPGDKVAIICPSWRIEGSIFDSIKLLESWGLEVILGKTVHLAHHQYAGDDNARAADFQEMLDDDRIKAIFAARGGYGAVRIIDQINFDPFIAQPKWIIGFSDITVIHSHIHHTCAIPTIHGQMPLTIPDGTKKSLESLRKALFGEPVHYDYKTKAPNKSGYAEALVIGGNLALLVNLLGSASDMDYNGKILFLEEVGEYYYAVDRMLWTLKRAGKLAGLKGLLIGGFTSLQEKKIKFGKDIKDLILELTASYNYPVAFNFPAGHIDDNRSLFLGKTAQLKVDQDRVHLSYQ